MRKSLLMMGVAIAALSSCTQNEVLNIADSSAIKFGNTFVGKPTKAITSPELTTANITDIYVFAQKNEGNVFDENPKHVYRVGDTNEWSYDNLVKWEASKTYNFIAYAGKDLSTSVTDATDHKSLKFENITVDGLAENQFDLLYSDLKEITTNAADGNSMIQFTFDHLLSMVKFTLKSGFGNTSTVNITGFKFYGLKTTETYDATTDSPSWTSASSANTSDDTNFIVTPAEGGDIAKVGQDVENSWVIIPQTNNTSDDAVEMVSFTAEVKDGEESIATKTFKVKIPKITWEKGMRYNYIFTINPESMEIEDEYITFDSPEINTWVDETLNIDNNTSSTEGVVLEPQP